MTDEVKPVEQVQEQATPPVTEPPSTETQKPEATQEQPTYVTREELNQIIAQTKREVKQADKQRAKQIKQEMDTMKQRLEAAGVPVTQEVEQKLHAQIVDSIRDDDEEEPTGAPQSDDIPPELLPAFTWMANQGDYKVLDTDPEYKEYLEAYLNKDNVDPAELTILFSRAVEAKKARTLQLKDKAPLRAPVGGGEGPGEFIAKSASDYRKRVAQERANK